MEIYCWGGDWGLPSIDIDCLHVLVSAIYASFRISIIAASFDWHFIVVF